MPMPGSFAVVPESKIRPIDSSVHGVTEASDDSISPAILSYLGDLTSGPVGLADVYGTVEVASNGTRVSIWVGAEDRWHVPTDEHSTRHDFPEKLPIPQTLVRVPSGDVEIRSYAAIPSASPEPVIAFEIKNSSPVPVAVAVVVDKMPEGSLATVTKAGIEIDGVLIVAFDGLRDAHCADDAEALLASLMTGELGAGFDRASNCVAAVAPLPHTATTSAVLSTSSEKVVAEGVPPLSSVIEGWNSHLGGNPQLGFAREEIAGAFSLARAVAGMGAGPDATLGEELQRVGARASLGDLEGADLVIEAALRSQNHKGEVEDDGDADATVAFLHAVTGLWDGGLDAEAAELLVGPVAKAGHYLAAPPRFSKKPKPVSSQAAEAIDRAAAMMLDLGQPELAEDLSKFVAGVEPLKRLSRFQNLANGATWSKAADGSPDFEQSVAFVRESIGLMATTTFDEIDLFGGWVGADAGSNVDLRGLNTRLGVVSASLRWHGSRPALLWEVIPLEGRSTPARLTASRLDPTFETSELSGETLLAEPVL